MKPLILVYYYDEGHNVLETMEVLLHVDLIIIIGKKIYDFYHVNTLINLKLPYC